MFFGDKMKLTRRQLRRLIESAMLLENKEVLVKMDGYYRSTSATNLRPGETKTFKITPHSSHVMTYTILSDCRSLEIIDEITGRTPDLVDSESSPGMNFDYESKITTNYHFFDDPKHPAYAGDLSHFKYKITNKSDKDCIVAFEEILDGP